MRKKLRRRQLEDARQPFDGHGAGERDRRRQAGFHRCGRVPAVSLPRRAGSQHAGSGLGIGAQDVSEHEGQGAYTGEVSAAMLAMSARNGRWSAIPSVVTTTARAMSWSRASLPRPAGGLTPILCVGETLEQREAGEAEAVIARQLQAVLALNEIASFDTAVIAYEPSGRSAPAARPPRSWHSRCTPSFVANWKKKML
jgi:hypothetical protein